LYKNPPNFLPKYCGNNQKLGPPPNAKFTRDMYIYRIKFRMLEVREIEISLLTLSGGTAQLRTLEGELVKNRALHVA